MTRLRHSGGFTLIELVSSLAVAALVVGSIYLLLGAVIKGRFIVHARVSDQERARQAMAWLADRLRQVNYDENRNCDFGFLMIGDGNGFERRLAFHAILEDPPGDRLRYVYYVEGETLYQEVRPEDTLPGCNGEESRLGPDTSGRVALTPPIVQGGGFAYIGRNGCELGQLGCDPLNQRNVYSVRISMTVEAESTSGVLERQTYQTVSTPRGP